MWRASVLLGALAAMLAAASVAASSPAVVNLTLGPSPDLVLEASAHPSVYVADLGNRPEVVAFTTSGGVTLAASEVAVGVGETVYVPLTGWGKAEGVVTATARLADPVAVVGASSAVGVSLHITVRHRTALEAFTAGAPWWPLAAALALCGAALLVTGALRRRLGAEQQHLEG